MLYIEILELVLARKKLHACFKSMRFATLVNSMLHVLFFLNDVETNTGDKVMMSFIAIKRISSRINIVNIEREEDLG